MDLNISQAELVVSPQNNFVSYMKARIKNKNMTGTIPLKKIEKYLGEFQKLAKEKGGLMGISFDSKDFKKVDERIKARLGFDIYQLFVINVWEKTMKKELEKFLKEFEKDLRRKDVDKFFVSYAKPKQKRKRVVFVNEFHDGKNFALIPEDCSFVTLIKK